MNLLKSFGLGLIIIILLPVLLLGAVIVGIVMLFEWIVVLIKGTIRFFKGDTFFEPLEEDLIVEKIKENELEKQMNNSEPAPTPQPTQQNVYVTNYYQYPNQAQPTPQPMPQQNPFLNNQANEQIPNVEHDYIDEQHQEIPYQESEEESVPMIDSNNEGGEQQ